MPYKVAVEYWTKFCVPLPTVIAIDVIAALSDHSPATKLT